MASTRHNTGASENRPLTHPQGSALRNLQFAALRIGRYGANPVPRVIGLDELPGKGNYLIWNDPANWHTQIPTYAKVRYEDVYPGIEIVCHGSQRQLEYDFIVAAGADPRAIRLSIDPARNIHVDAAGDLVASLGGAEIRQHRSRVYQEMSGAQKEIPGHYALTKKDEIRFEVAQYDAAKPLVIDSTLVYSTYLDGTFVGVREAHGIAVDSGGNAYVTGSASL